MQVRPPRGHADRGGHRCWFRCVPETAAERCRSLPPNRPTPAPPARVVPLRRSGRPVSSSSSASQPPSTVPFVPSPRAVSRRRSRTPRPSTGSSTRSASAGSNTVQSLIIGNAALVTLVNWIYIWGHWPVIIAAATFLYVRRPTHYRVLRNAIITSGLIGFLFFYEIPTAPPRLVDLGLVGHGARALPRLPRPAAAVADQPVRGDAEPPLRLEPPRRDRPLRRLHVDRRSRRSPSQCPSQWGSR